MSGGQIGIFGILAYVDEIEKQDIIVAEAATAFEFECNIAIHDHDEDDELEIGWGAATPTVQGTLVAVGTPAA